MDCPTIAVIFLGDTSSKKGRSTTLGGSTYRLPLECEIGRGGGLASWNGSPIDTTEDSPETENLFIK